MFNMKECRTGDKLLSKHGMILIYEEYLPLEYYPHIIRYPNKAKGSRTDEGYVYRNNRLPADEEIIDFAENSKPLILIRQLYLHRKKRKELKEKLAKHLRETGGCSYYSENGGDYCYSENSYHPPKIEEYWCDICQQSKPIHEEFLKESRLSGNYLTKILNIGRKLNNV